MSHNRRAISHYQCFRCSSHIIFNSEDHQLSSISVASSGLFLTPDIRKQRPGSCVKPPRPFRYEHVWLLSSVRLGEFRRKADPYLQPAQARSIPSLLRLRSWLSDELRLAAYSEVDEQLLRSSLRACSQTCNELSLWSARYRLPKLGVRSHALDRHDDGHSNKPSQWHQSVSRQGFPSQACSSEKPFSPLPSRTPPLPEPLAMQSENRSHRASARRASLKRPRSDRLRLSDADRRMLFR